MLKKAGILTVGVTAGLLAVAPLASAGEATVKGDHDSHSKSKDSDDDNGKDHGKKHHKSHGKDHHKASQSCDTKGGSAGAGSEIDGDSLANAVTQAPVGGAAVGSIASCNSDFLNDNLSHNKIALLGGIL